MFKSFYLDLLSHPDTVWRQPGFIRQFCQAPADFIAAFEHLPMVITANKQISAKAPTEKAHVESVRKSLYFWIEQHTTSPKHVALSHYLFLNILKKTLHWDLQIKDNFIYLEGIPISFVAQTTQKKSSLICHGIYSQFTIKTPNQATHKFKLNAKLFALSVMQAYLAELKKTQTWFTALEKREFFL